MPRSISHFPLFSLSQKSGSFRRLPIAVSQCTHQPTGNASISHPAARNLDSLSGEQSLIDSHSLRPRHCSFPSSFRRRIHQRRPNPAHRLLAYGGATLTLVGGLCTHARRVSWALRCRSCLPGPPLPPSKYGVLTWVLRCLPIMICIIYRFLCTFIRCLILASLPRSPLTWSVIGVSSATYNALVFNIQCRSVQLPHGTRIVYIGVGLKVGKRL